MCGVVGFNLQNKDALNLTLKSLHFLEYRGYDSAGVAFLLNNNIKLIKTAGRVLLLEEMCKNFTQSSLAIGHTRWATHGKPTSINAHPHYSQNIHLVHNGIIENYQEIKKSLIEDGYNFQSETDTEVIAHFLHKTLKSTNIHQAISLIFEKLHGKYAIAFIIQDENEKYIYSLRSTGSPMVIGILPNGNAIASDFNAIAHQTNKYIPLEDYEYAIISNKDFTIFEKSGKKITKTPIIKNVEETKIEKGEFETFMMKEIHEQSFVVDKILNANIEKNKIISQFPNVNQFDKISIIACGTSYFAGCLGKYLIETYSQISVTVEISSEFHNRKQIFSKNTLYIFASQSGETADTIAALEYTKKNKTECSKILSILNVVESTMGQKSDLIIECLSGPEVGVASTKNFIAQVVIFYLLAIKNSKMESEVISELQKIPSNIISILESQTIEKQIHNAVTQIISANKVVYTGRTLLYPIACEGSLKLSELSYIPVQSIASGEFKHGPIAIVDDQTVVISLMHTSSLFQKTLSSNEEIASRNGIVITISDDKNSSISIPYAKDFTQTYPILLTIIVQLLSYYTAKSLGNDIDKPRNLAKSVTVE
jgi:glucosamine--fructose-6-phosphate aminotransferase (isomerizing)